MRPAAEIFNDLNSVGAMILILAALIGVCVFLYGLYVFWKAQSEPNRYNAGIAVRNLIAGSLLLTPGTFYSTLKASAVDPSWTHSNDALAINSSALQQGANDLSNSFIGAYISTGVISAVLGLLFIIGLWGYLRGLYLIRELGLAGPGQGTGPGKVMAHLIGGLILMNTVTVASGISSIFFA